MAEWDTHAEELTVLFSVETKFWNSLNKTQQQQLVKDHAVEAAASFGEVSKLKGYRIATDVVPPTPEEVVVHSELWVIPNKVQRAVLDGQ